MEANYLSVKEAAAFCGLSERSIRRGIWSGELAAYSPPNRLRPTWRIKKTDLEKWMERERAGIKQPPPVKKIKRAVLGRHYPDLA